MKARSFRWLLALLFAGQLVVGSPARAQVVVRGGYYAPPRVYYGPRYYCPLRPVVVYAVPPPRPVVVAAPYYAPRRYYAPPRHYYGSRGRGYHGRYR
ncbi:hypothetical protein I2I05_05915 [Hymenobacter sp. BT683]|uniref:Virulence factor n=1 Tax=Hymenobacter jeongseonensis TaxID=2791027 RepID=A0ABS0IEZ3_9BACT|nr:hypothetical protein [Hymenobacter jeongseonensis]MBF9236926.1 hypothetical protein [Hymenobacter jeongseonensis]